MRKERFPEHRKSMLMLKGDGSFRITEGVNSYKMDL
jgi:hypothetical protein